MKLFRLLLTPFAFLCVGLIRLIWRWKIVRIGDLWSTRIGHLVGNTECYLCEKDAGLHNGFLDLWYSQSNSANKTIEKKYRSQLNMIPTWLGDLTVRVNRLFVGWERHEVRSTQFDRDVHNLWEKHSPHIEFTVSEEKKGKRLLRKLGIPDGAKWVCLIVRDGAYLKAVAPGQDFSYHDYRDSDIHNYVPTVLELVRRGYYVIRMGHHVDKPLRVKHSRVIDYAWDGHRTEFGDLYLGAKCAFCIGSCTGFVSIPQVFRRPICFVNHVPLEYSPTFYEHGLMIFKHHEKDGKRMSFREIFDSGAGQFTFRQQFEKAGITLVENTSQEIYSAVMEMEDILIQHPRRARFLQHNFWNEFSLRAVDQYNGKPLHGKARVRIGKDFLKGYS